MSAGKWIKTIHTETPLREAAQQVLSARFAVVRNHLRLAQTHWQSDPEHVHQLRVGIRRAEVALQIFAECIPTKVWQKSRKELKRLRRAVSQPRDWDVFVLNLSEQIQADAESPHPGWNWLMGYGVSQRISAQNEFHKRVSEFNGGMERVVEKVLASVRKSKKTLGDLAGPLLEQLLTQLETAAGKDFKDSEHFHDVRKDGKRLRYAMEVFVNCFATEFRTVHYASIEAMQEILGRANDSFVAIEQLRWLHDLARQMLPNDWERIQPDIVSNLQFHEERYPEERKRFEDWWRHWNESGTLSEFKAMIHPNRVCV